MLSADEPDRKDQLRGVLTNGFQWIFFIVYINKDGKGGTFKKSVPIMFAPQAQYFTGEMKMTIPQHIPDMICGILTYWVSLLLAHLTTLIEVTIARTQLRGSQRR